MAKIKHTKNELKAQREALARYERFLPMLQLKKQQLQAELLRIDNELEETASGLRRFREGIEDWIALFSEDAGIGGLLAVRTVDLGESNIAGVNVPVFRDVIFDRRTPDLFAGPPWVDDGLDAIEQLIRLSFRRRILEKQRELVGAELRVTSQRVNLFEKVKIPECREHIRVIRIFLGDEQTAGVARAKIAKGRMEEMETAAAA